MKAVVDSSAWIEYLVGGPNAGEFEAPLSRTEELIVPAITITEVYGWMLREASEAEALTVAAAMRQGRVVDLDDHLSIAAAALSRRHELPLVEGIVYATARQEAAQLWTQDADLDGLAEVVYVKPCPRQWGT